MNTIQKRLVDTLNAPEFTKSFLEFCPRLQDMASQKVICEPRIISLVDAIAVGLQQYLKGVKNET